MFNQTKPYLTSRLVVASKIFPINGRTADCRLGF